ncbi:MAG TPA: hypothetical protein VLJ86_18080 [Ramlibacter sp.]|nr:hypothetical protein [Ramlibacter sp.]
MITSKDSEFHPVAKDNWRWTETTPLTFSVPEAGILGNLYIAARPNLGVALSSVGVVKGFRFLPHQVDFSDAQMHLPCPDNFTHYELASGLRVEVTKAPREYHFQYEYKLGGGCSFDLNFRGLHEPFDAADPQQNPLLETEAGHRFDERLGTQWGNPATADNPSGHFELMGNVTGELVLRGVRYKVNCYDCVDHSWSQRTETSKRAVGWISAVFGDDYGIHLTMLLDVKNGKTIYESLRSGFVMDKGEVHGLVSATMEGYHSNHSPMNVHIVATDVRGVKHEIFGNAIAVHPWHNFNPSHVAFQSLMQWRCGTRIGYSEMADIFGLEYLAERQAA